MAKQKRRTDSEGAENPKRSEIWFEDGNIVLEAEGTQFRVHRGILSLNSPIFNTMVQGVDN